MRPERPLLLAFGLLVIFQLPAQAQDYPFSGNFVISGGSEAPAASDPALCAHTFFTQGKDGGFVSYHIDLELFRATGAPHFVVYTRGSCRYQPAPRIETCTTSFNSVPSDINKTFFDVLGAVEDDFVQTTAFDKPLEAVAFALTRQIGSGYPLAYFRCPFDPARLAAAVSDDVSTLDTEARNAATSPDAATLASIETARLMAALGLVADK